MAAGMEITGLTEVQADMATLAQISSDDIMAEVILPAAQILVDAFREAATSALKTVTGSLANSFKVLRQGEDWALVGPNQGKHPHSTGGKRKPRAQGGGGGHYGGTNAEVAYIQEYGTVRIPGKHFMEQAGDEHEGEILAAMQEAFYALLDRLTGAA